MKRLSRLHTFAAILAVLTVTPLSSLAQQYPFQDTSLPVEQRVDDLVARLTLDEKIGFLEHQNPAVERLGIKPYSWWNEALHGIARNGIATVYPMPIALAATFHPGLVEEVYGHIADEGVLKHLKSQQDGEYGDNTGITFFTPNINIFRDPRWGRGMETFGEDPFLTAQMGLAAVRGLQAESEKRKAENEERKAENDVDAEASSPFSHLRSHISVLRSPFLKSAACLKHLAVHSGPEGLRHEFNSVVSGSDLWTTYLPAFEYIIKHSDVQQVMCGYNRLNGEPCCTNHHLLVDILRNRWNYDGIIVTDCWALNDCWEPDTVIPRHRTHPTAAKAAEAAFGSEVDLECGSGLAALKTAVDSGYISESQIDTHLRRVLRTRFRIRPERFSKQSDDPYKEPRTVASHSLVMLKNNGILPLDDLSQYSRIAVIGPNAADSAMALGNYNGEPPYLHTIADAFRQAANQQQSHAGNSNTANAAIYFDTACHHADNDYLLPADFWPNIKKSDLVVFCGGLSPALEGEELQVELPGFHRGDRTSIELPAAQRNMIKEIRLRTGKPIVLVLCTGSAIALGNVIDDVDAVVVAWYGGQDMGHAVADALMGHSNDFGRLPVTFYSSTSQLPDFANYSMQGRTYRYMTEKPLYPFGFGLSYAHTHFDSVTFDRNTLTLSGRLIFDSIASGCTAASAKEIVQVYLEDPSFSEGPRRRLVALETMTLPAKSPNIPSFSFKIPIDPFWLRRYDADSDSMELPPPGTPLRLQLMNGPAVDFVW